MKILVLQLARFGDIYQTWPTLRALHRQHPDADIHLLVRQKFVAATIGLVNVTVRTMPTADLLAPVVKDGTQTHQSEELLSNWLSDLGSDWDLIINLSFSPTSSFIVDYLSSKETQVRGYTRHSDG